MLLSFIKALCRATLLDKMHRLDNRRILGVKTECQEAIIPGMCATPHSIFERAAKNL